MKLLGFATASPSLGAHTFVLNRFLISCCAADATAIRLVMVDADPVPKQGKWVEVTAQLDPHYIPPPGADASLPTIAMRVHDVRPADEPSGPYEALR